MNPVPAARPLLPQYAASVAPAPLPGFRGLSAAQQQAQFAVTVEVLNNPVPGSDKDLWLAARRDGKPGRGTRSDPLNASTPERLDAILDGIGNRPANIRMQEGKYHASLVHHWRVRNGWHLSGAGAGRTVISIVNPVPKWWAPWWWSGEEGYHGGANAMDYYCHQASVRDLTIDGSVTSVLSDTRVNAITLMGGDITVESVEVRRCGGGFGEQFPVTVANDWRHGLACRLIINRCVIKDTLCGQEGSSAIVVAGADAATLRHGTNRKQYAEVTNNKVIAAGYLGVANFCNWRFTGNEVDMAGLPGGTAPAFNADTGECRNGVIEKNTFRNAFHQYRDSGVVIIGGNGVFADIRIARNYLHTRRNGFRQGALKLQGNTRNIDFENNRCAVQDSAATYAGTVIEGTGNTGLRRRGNRMMRGRAPEGLADN